MRRAITESTTKVQIGDQIGLRRVRREPVTVKIPVTDASGAIIGEQAQVAHRNRWVEKVEFFDNVRPRESSVQMVGVITAVRDSTYVVIRWDDRYQTTHSRESAELIVRPPLPFQRRHRTSAPF